ncbi:MAG: MFS transporter [Candidatus Lokiarchaeota archaeon]|nr:MFS transporter [Candidatus Lokiarchaeota archaeon]
MGITEDIPSIQVGDADKCENLFSYRAWPIFMISFCRLFFISIFERAFQNYIYFDQGVSESMLGIISSAPLIAYIFGPILGHLITKKIGIRNSIILSAICTPLLVGAQMLYFDPFYLISIRVLSGLLLGVFWPNCYNLLSRWQSVSSDDKSNKNFRHFNFSWNLGFISGLLVGYIWAFSLDEYVAMTFAFVTAFSLPLFSLFLKKESELNHINKNFINKNNELKLKSSTKPQNQQNSNNKMIAYPILFSWVALLIYAASKSVFRFSYPVFLKSSGSPSYFTYLIQLSMQVGQLIGLTWSNSMKFSNKKKSVFGSIIMLLLSSIVIIIVQDLIYISIISATIGLFVGLIQGTSLKIMIDYGAAENTKKYSTFNEILKGIGFGLTPIAAGFIAEINIYGVFIFLIVLGSTALLILAYLSRRKKMKVHLEIRTL